MSSFGDITFLEIFEATLADGGENVDPADAVAVELDPEFADASAEVTTTGPGLATASDLTVVEGRFTNLLDEPIDFLVGYITSYALEIDLVAPGESAEAIFDAQFLVDGEFLGFDGDEARAVFGGPGCFGSGSCNVFVDDANGPIFGVRLEAGETAPVQLIAAAEVSAVAPVPLPAALGPAALGVAALAWLGRRGGRRRA